MSEQGPMSLWLKADTANSNLATQDEPDHARRIGSGMIVFYARENPLPATVGTRRMDGVIWWDEYDSWSLEPTTGTK